MILQKTQGHHQEHCARLIAKLSENCQTDVFAIGNIEVNGNWVDDLAKTSNTPVKTIYNWWSSFCKETVEEFNALLNLLRRL